MLLLNEQPVWQGVLQYKSLVCRCCWGQMFCCSPGTQEEGVLLTQLHVQEAVRLLPALCEAGVTASTTILTVDEATTIPRAWKLEIIN